MQSTGLIFLLTLIVSSAFSDQVEVIDVQVNPLARHQYQFAVTLQHADSGWEHYADRWEILDTQGNVLATRTLYHPHVNEQPFTRSLSTIVPDNIKKVVIRGHDKVHQYGKKEISVVLPYHGE